MDRQAYLRVVAYGVLINSALYLAGCFLVALVTLNPIAWRFTIAAAGVTYLSYNALFASEHLRLPWLCFIAEVLVMISILLGAAAGVAVLAR